MTYDTLGREIQRIDPDSGTWIFGYDASGNLVFEDDPKTSQHVQACYDGIDRITKRYVFLTGDAYVSDACSLPAPESTYSYDSVAGGNFGIGRLTAISDPSGGESWVYDLRGNVTSNSKTVLGKTAVMASTYDEVDRLHKLTYFGTEQVTYVYRADGQFRSLINYVSDAHYDIFGRLELLRHANGTDDSATFYGGSENFRLERLTTVKSGVTTPYLDLQYQYNALGQVERIDDLRNPTGDLSNGAIYGYDGLGRLTSVDWLAGATYDESFTYDSLGNLTSLGGKTLSYPGRPHQALSRSDGAQMLYDSNGSRSQKSTSSETQGYAFDGLGRLSTVNLSLAPTDPPTKNVQYTYDAGGNRVARVVTTSGQAAATRRYFNSFVESFNGTATKYYFAAGRLVASQDVVTNLLSEVPPGTAPPPVQLPRLPLAVAACLLGLVFLLLLGPGRRRVHIGVNVAPARAAAVAFAFLVASIPLLMGPQCGGGGPPPPIRHFHLDHLGSLQAVSDGPGSLIGQSRYRPYGTTRRYDGAGTSAPANEKGRHEFIGYETEIDTGLAYAYARFYDPDLGQFMSHDPVGELPSPYAYTHGDPINYFDPSGAFAELAIGISIFVLWILKVAYNYDRSGGDWEFALQEGVQTPVPTEGPVVGPTQSGASLGYNGYASSLVASGAESELTLGAPELAALDSAISYARSEGEPGVRPPRAPLPPVFGDDDAIVIAGKPKGGGSESALEGKTPDELKDMLKNTTDPKMKRKINKQLKQKSGKGRNIQKQRPGQRAPKKPPAPKPKPPPTLKRPPVGTPPINPGGTKLRSWWFIIPDILNMGLDALEGPGACPGENPELCA